MDQTHNTLFLRLMAVLLALVGLALAGGGGWLLALGGSWFYLALGLLLLVAAVLLWQRRPAGLTVFAAGLLATLAWSLAESGLDWWALAPRGGLPVVLGLLLLLPWALRPLGQRLLRGPALVLGLVVLACLVAAPLSLLADPHARQGRLPVQRIAEDPLTIQPGEWHAYGRTGFGQRFSPLDQITPANVAALEMAWQYRTGDVRGRPGDPQETTFQVTPLKLGNRLFLCTPHQLVIALDATTGEEVWRYDPDILNPLALQHLTCRGLGYAPTMDAADAPAPDPARLEAARAAVPGLPVATEGAETTRCGARLFMPTADGRVIALDPETGAVCADFGAGTGQINLWANMPNVKPGAYYSTSPPAVANGVLVVGGTVLDNVSTNEQSGVIRGYDVRSGALLWNWDSGAPEEVAPIAAEATYTANSPNAWSILSVDAGLGLVYVPLGNQPPDQFGGNRSPAVERFSSAVVALDLRQGALRWVFQTVHHDLWDYDVPSQPTLVDLTINGATVPALVQPTKQGEIFVLDRRTGQPLLPVREVAAPQGAAEGDFTAATQPVSALSFDPPRLTGRQMWGATLLDQLACRIQLRRLRYEGRYTPPSLQGSLVHPGNFGVFNWGGIAVDPERQVAFTTPAYLAFVSRLVPRADATTLYVQADGAPPGPLPALNENFGAPYAVELKPFLSPIGLPCQQPPWGYVAGADLRTGEIAWQHRNGTVRDLSPVPLPFRLGVPDLGGPVMTRGGVAFMSGTLDDFVRGYDVTTGAQLWESRLPAGGQATPMTYLGADGRQYLLVVAGGHGSLGTTPGDHVIAYALPR
ncbi:membrane-bound PQQ-dependent dehydrogenase, glucose/quinate/shikimate family [Falsiroseomonas selenitidurans]|uniref:Membrane-bound PQQ-dependent dehydrogenase, glucose/quinate/shikimate family n=1 Tax=Falsiroseomonas selenitidurans TaxID=2716335 RepID=A0ABX1E5D7_9PROT|nr:membrane-bound PQQ-dependent dehydrogenase, glucose/quinate/shikimate family [Falsiroseomonas selenitidurans]NKC32390.1 membrane-bound PQQ-dependent dehydrogenase, glucose/quinate/shikimate family [Falsiroseomonas selenitidurans]